MEVLKRLKPWMKKVLVLAVVVGLILLSAGYVLFYKKNTGFPEKEHVILVPQNCSVDEFFALPDASNLIDNETSFQFVASLKRLKTVKKGRYVFKYGSSNLHIINRLRSGDQNAIRIRIDDCGTLDELAGRLGSQLQNDSLTFLQYFSEDSVLQKYGYNVFTLSSMVVPDTYDFFWTMTPNEFLDKMKALRNKFWTSDKLEKAKVLGLSPTEVIILASIVKGESRKLDEAPKIAGLYLNRLRINMPLQADPTSVFAARLKGVARVSLAITQVKSPFNTYDNPGLPPGPISLVEGSYIDAVLNPESHDYLYMCAQPGFTGYHNFAVSLDQHNEYRREYLRFLDSRGL